MCVAQVAVLMLLLLLRLLLALALRTAVTAAIYRVDKSSCDRMLAGAKVASSNLREVSHSFWYQL
jgi:hypothetical protein